MTKRNTIDHYEYSFHVFYLISSFLKRIYGNFLQFHENSLLSFIFDGFQFSRQKVFHFDDCQNIQLSKVLTFLFFAIRINKIILAKINCEFYLMDILEIMADTFFIRWNII